MNKYIKDLVETRILGLDHLYNCLVANENIYPKLKLTKQSYAKGILKERAFLFKFLKRKPTKLAELMPFKETEWKNKEEVKVRTFNI